MAGGEDTEGDDEAWLEQLRGALASAGEAESEDTETANGDAVAWPEPLVVRTATSQDIRSALEALEQRLAELESLVRQLAERPSPPLQRDDMDAFVDHVVDALAVRLGAGSTHGLFDPVADPETLRETGDLGGVADRLEAQQRRLLQELAVDRQRLIADAIAEIRTLLFGK